ncbi:MAG: (2Fe-2S)-binding protein [Candidatus Bipolaricaulia bacterium]
MAKAVKPQTPKALTRGPTKTPVRLQINGEVHEVFIEPRRTLLDVIREDLGLTGTKKGCDEGTCGACTVLSNGKPVYACLTLAIECEDREMETIENLSQAGRLHPIQQAFIENDALQCGFCTPGQIMSIKALLDTNPSPTLDDIKRTVSGNLCRCGAYPKIFQAAKDAAERLASES